MNTKTTIAAAFLFLSAGCAGTMNRNFEATLFEPNTGKVLPLIVQITGRGTGGSAVAILPNGERLTGMYSAMIPGARSGGWSQGRFGPYTTQNFYDTWTTSNTANAQLTVSGPRGLSLHCEFAAANAYQTSGHGACVDNAGTGYKMQFIYSGDRQ